MAPAEPRSGPAGQRCGPVFGLVNHSRQAVVEGRWRRTGPPAGWAHLLSSFPPLDSLLSVPEFGATPDGFYGQAVRGRPQCETVSFSTQPVALRREAGEPGLGR
jgi:hypothetical protein